MLVLYLKECETIFFGQMTGDGIARVRGGGEATCKRRHLYEGKPRWPRCTFNYAHHPEKLSGHEQLSTLSTLTSEKCRYSRRKIYPGRKIWSLICPIPDASVQALEQVKEIGGFFSSINKFSYQLQLQIELHIFGHVDVREWERETTGSPPICQILGASNPHRVSDPRLSDFYPRHVHGAFIDIRSLSPRPWATAHPSSAPLHPPHAH